jgi:hypothetical protein
MGMITKFLDQGGFLLNPGLLDHAIFKKVSITQDEQKFIDSLSGKTMNTLEMIAVNLITDFTHPSIHSLIQKFDYPDFFCAGTEAFRGFLKEKAQHVQKVAIEILP